MKDVVMLLSKSLDLFWDYVVTQCLSCCREQFVPIVCQVYKMTLVHRDDPVVWEVLVHNFSHLSILLFKDLGHEA